MGSRFDREQVPQVVLYLVPQLLTPNPFIN